jgi:hypothetical protein
VTYEQEAAQLDAEILRSIEQRSVPDFNELAMRIFTHQLRYNAPYAKYCATFGVTPDALPSSWEAIPPVPTGAYKEAVLATFEPQRAELVFETSGTTRGVGGKHYMENPKLYDAALLSGFRDAILADAPKPFRYFMLVPNPVQRPQSSLGYMMRKVAQTYGDGHERWYLDHDVLHVDEFVADARAATEAGSAACIAGTAFAFVQLLDALEERGITSLPLASGSRIMETGGFKGRTRVVQRSELYAALQKLFTVSPERIVAEYGMTELTSQYYDDVMLRYRSMAEPAEAPRIKRGPPWMRARVVGPDNTTLPQGIVGALVHVDLANRSSCVAVQTEDLGVETEDGGIILIGREQGAELRGCSLDAETLRTLARA